MFTITISSSETYVYRESNTNNLMGFLIHQEGIKELIGAIPISKYYVQTGQGSTEEISKE